MSLFAWRLRVSIKYVWKKCTGTVWSHPCQSMDIHGRKYQNDIIMKTRLKPSTWPVSGAAAKWEDTVDIWSDWKTFYTDAVWKCTIIYYWMYRLSRKYRLVCPVLIIISAYDNTYLGIFICYISSNAFHNWLHCNRMITTTETPNNINIKQSLCTQPMTALNTLMSL